MFAFSPQAFSAQAFSPVAFAIDAGGVQPAVPPAPTFGGGESAAERDRLIHEHHDYLDGLREIQVQIADDVRGARTISLRADMVVHDEILPPAMRGTVQPVLVGDVIGQPAVLAAIALLIDEADE